MPSASPAAEVSSLPASAPRTECVPQLSPPPSGSWPVYSDATYGFKISYPPGFKFVSNVGVPAPGVVMLALYRAVDECMADYPPGQVELGVFTYDATSLTAWVQKHSDVHCAGSNSTAFIFGVSNVQSVTVDGRQALTFDDMFSGCGGPMGSGQETAFLLSPNYVFMIGWWAARDAYAPTIRGIASEMLSTFNAA